MNILLLNYEYPPIGAGAANATYNMAKSILVLGHKPIVITSAFENLIGRSVEEGIVVYRLSAGRKFKDHSNILQMLYFMYACWWNLKQIIKDEKLDSCIAFFTIPCGPIALYAKWKWNLPYIISLRGGDVPGTEPSLSMIHAIMKPLRKKIFNNAKKIIANSRGLAQLSEKSDPFPVDVIPNGVDCNFFKPKEYKENSDIPIQCLFVGRFQEQKNLLNLVRQFSAALKKNPNLILKLVGNGPQKVQVFSIIEELEIQKHIQWCDWQDKASLSKTYRSADIFINPSLYEGMPNTVMEAMASGLPIIASDIFGNNDLVIDGETGRLFSLGAIDSLSEQILDMASSFTIRKMMGEAGRKRVFEHFSWLHVSDTYLKIFEREHS